MTTGKEEMKRLVLQHLLEMYPEQKGLTEVHYRVAYKVVRASAILSTLNWKLDNLTVAQ